GYVDPKYPNGVCKLQRDIYGLKQASRQWSKRFDEEIKRFGFIQNRDEPCVYHKASGSDVVFLILYVDDILIMGNNIPRLKEVKDYLGKYEEKAYMKKVPYASAVGSIMYAVRCTRPDVAFAQNLCTDEIQIQNLRLQVSVMRPGNAIKMIRSLRRVMSLSPMEEQ
nr:putative retrotransposon protein [Tanacetum cinerariifolium]